MTNTNIHHSQIYYTLFSNPNTNTNKRYKYTYKYKVGFSGSGQFKGTDTALYG